MQTDLSIFPEVPKSQEQRRQLRRELQRQAEAQRAPHLPLPLPRLLDAESSGRRMGLYKVNRRAFDCSYA